MTPGQREFLARMETWARVVGGAVEESAQERFGKRLGFIVYVFEFGESHLSTYLSNSNRDDCVKALRELLERIEQKGFTGTTQETN